MSRFGFGQRIGDLRSRKPLKTNPGTKKSCGAISLPARLLMAFVLVGLCPLAPAQAQAPAPAKIAVVDTERILLGSATGKRVLADLKKLQEAKEGELRALQQEIKDLQTRIEEGRLSLSQDQLATLQRQLEDKVASGTRAQEDATRELNRRRDEMLAAIDQQVMPVINGTAEELGYDMVFRKFESGLIYVRTALDITDEVIRRLDAAQSAP
jgi:Skp family chaperone for outer membrane proteins